MDVTVVRPSELGAPEIARWRELQVIDPRLANPFLTPEFAVVYGRHNPAVRIAVIEDGDGIVGFFPHEKAGLGVGRSLAHRFSDCQGMVVDPARPPAVQELMARCGLAVFEFDHLVEHQARAFVAQPMLRPSPVIDLSVGWDAWVADKRSSGSRIKRTLEKRRKLEREIGPLSFTYDSRDHDDLTLLMAWKTAQYARTGRPDAFSTWRRDVLHDLLDTREGAFSIRLARLDAGDRTVALYFCTRGGGMLGSWFPAYDVDLGKYSPGLISVLSMAEAAAADGITKIDLGKGHEDYKTSLKNGDDTVGRGAAERRVPAAAWWRLRHAPRRTVSNLMERSPRAFRLVDGVLRTKARIRSGTKGG